MWVLLLGKFILSIAPLLSPLSLPSLPLLLLPVSPPSLPPLSLSVSLSHRKDSQALWHDLQASLHRLQTSRRLPGHLRWTLRPHDRDTLHVTMATHRTELPISPGQQKLMLIVLMYMYAANGSLTVSAWLCYVYDFLWLWQFFDYVMHRAKEWEKKGMGSHRLKDVSWRILHSSILDILVQELKSFNLSLSLFPPPLPPSSLSLSLTLSLSLSHSQSRPSVELEPGDKATECHCLVVPKPSTTPPLPPSSSSSSSSSVSAGDGHSSLSLSLGTYTIRWKRATSSHPHSLISTVSFPPITAKLRPFTISAGMSTLSFFALRA